MGSMLRANDAAAPFKVLVVGGSYGGMTAASRLSDLCLGNPPQLDPSTPAEPETPIHVEITVVDERDGFCTRCSSPQPLPTRMLTI